MFEQTKLSPDFSRRQFTQVSVQARHSGSASGRLGFWPAFAASSCASKTRAALSEAETLAPFTRTSIAEKRSTRSTAAPRVARRAKRGAQGRNRTTDTAIFSRMLYQLSYLGMTNGALKEPSGRRFIVGSGGPVHPSKPVKRVVFPPRRTPAGGPDRTKSPKPAPAGLSFPP